MKKTTLILFQMICVISFITSCSQSANIDDLSTDKCMLNNSDLEIAHTCINKNYTALFGAKEDAEQVELVQRKLFTILKDMNSNDEIVSYADKINKSIVATNLDEELYRDIKTIVDITINSMLYWNDKIQD